MNNRPATAAEAPAALVRPVDVIVIPGLLDPAVPRTSHRAAGLIYSTLHDLKV
jgi:hypothetical protein